MQRALVRHDRAALAGFASRHGDISLSVRAAGERAAGRGGRSASAPWSSADRPVPLGSVDAVEHLPVLLHHLCGADENDACASRASAARSGGRTT